LNQEKEMSANHDSVSGVVMDYINCSRGKAISAIFKSLEATADLETRWQWVEEMSKKPSDVLRVGGLDGLLSICHHDIPRAMRLFEALCDNHQNVLRTEYAHRFLFWAIYRKPDECRIFIDALLQDPLDSMKRTGAEMATVLALQPNRVDLTLIEKLKSGPLSWQEGLIEVASNSVTSDLAEDTLATCIDILRWSFQQTNNDRHHIATRFSHQLKEEHLDTLRPLLEDFVTSPIYSRGDRGFHEFLLRYGDLEPDWTLTQIETILRRSDVKEKGFQRLGEEELSRCVLRLYNLTSSNTQKGQEFRARAMDVFGELMEKSPLYSNRILKEWDEGHDGRFL
jgi:hypothetical protein